MFYALLKQSKLEMLEDNLEFMFAKSNSKFSFFSKMSGLCTGEDTALSDYFFSLALLQHVSRSNRSEWEIKEDDLKQTEFKLSNQLAFDQKELALLKKIGLGLVHPWNLTSQFRNKSQYKSFTSKVRFNNLPLNNVYSDLVTKINTVWKEMMKKDPAFEIEIFW